MKLKIPIILALLLIEFFSFALSTNANDLKPILIDSLFKEKKLEGLVNIYSTDYIIDVDSFWKNKNTKDILKISSNNFLPGMADKYYWVVMSLKNTDKTRRNIILGVNNSQIDSIFFYEVKANSRISLLSENGDEIPFYKRKMPNELPIFDIEMNSGGEKTFILMLRKRKNIKFPLKIYSKQTFKLQSRKKIFVYSVYFGSILLIFVSFFTIGFFTRNKLLLSYALYSLSIGLYLFTDSGYAFEFLYSNTFGLNSALRVPLSMMMFLSFMLFTNLFLEIKKNKKYISSIFSIFSIIWISIYLLSLPFLWIYTSAYHSFILVTHYLFAYLSIFLMIFAVIKVFKFNKQKSIPYIFAVAMLFLGGSSFLIAQLGFPKANFSFFNPFMLASIGELAVFSVALFFNLQKLNIQRNKLLLITAKQEKEILTAHIKGNESASLRISSELHDNIGSRLALIKNKLLNNANNNIEISEDIGNVYDNVRDISHRLSTNSFFMLGFKAAVAEYLDEINQNNKSGITAFFDTDIEDNSVDKEILLQAFRIIQEAVLNSVKYAGKSEVQVQLIYQDGIISLTIEDNGKGFDLNNLENKNGIGLKNIEMRSKLLKAEFEINSQLNKGTFISIIIPVPE